MSNKLPKLFYQISYISNKRVNRLCDTANTILSMVGLRATSHADVESVKKQADAIARFHTEMLRDKNSLKVGVSCIIFSMDRAIQLHALLGSLFEKLDHPITTFVIFRSTDRRHEKAYEEIKDLFADKPVVFIKQGSKESFKEQLIDTIRSIDTKKMFFLVDDILIIENIEISDLADTDCDKYTLSLRLGLNLNHSYIVNRALPLPTFLSLGDTLNEKICWKWTDGKYDWNYPLSVDGHLFLTNEVLTMTEGIYFNSPNTYESCLQIYRPIFDMRLGLAYKKSKLFNVPCNRVQNDVANFHGQLHQDTLLKKWSDGYRIDYSEYFGFNNTGVHQDVAFKLIKRDPTKPKITVLMPVYNGERFLRDAIDSILAQTFYDFELLIINDGSTDDSQKIIESYDDPRIKLVNNEANKGLSVTRNRGLELARGEYIANLDCDDCSYPQRLEKQADFLDDNPDFGLIGTFVEPIDKDGNSLSHDIWSFPARAGEIPAILFFNNYFAQSATMIRRSSIPEMKYREDLPPAEDYDLWIRISENSKVWNLQEILTRLRIHDRNTSIIHKGNYPLIMPKIYSYQLTKLGISYSSSELHDHYLFCTGQYGTTVELAEKMKIWLYRLGSANNEMRLYDQIIFLKAILGRWYLYCKRIKTSRWSSFELSIKGFLYIIKDYDLMMKSKLIYSSFKKYALFRRNN